MTMAWTAVLTERWEGRGQGQCWVCTGSAGERLGQRKRLCGEIVSVALSELGEMPAGRHVLWASGEVWAGPGGEWTRSGARGHCGAAHGGYEASGGGFGVFQVMCNMRACVHTAVWELCIVREAANESDSQGCEV